MDGKAWKAFCVLLVFVGLAHGQEDGASRFPDLVRGESVEATGDMEVLFVRASGGNKYIPLGPLDVARLRRALAECPPGLSAEVAAMPSAAMVKVVRGSSTLTGNGAKVMVRARISADDRAELGERVVSVRFPFIREFSLANPRYRTAPGAIALRVKVWESREALARERAAKKAEVPQPDDQQANEEAPKEDKQGLTLWILVGAGIATLALLGLLIGLCWPKGEQVSQGMRTNK
jgi:hypothetical protein